MNVGTKSTTLQTRALLVYTEITPTHKLHERKGISTISANISGKIGATTERISIAFLLTEKYWDES